MTSPEALKTRAVQLEHFEVFIETRMRLHTATACCSFKDRAALVEEMLRQAYLCGRIDGAAIALLDPLLEMTESLVRSSDMLDSMMKGKT